MSRSEMHSKCPLTVPDCSTLQLSRRLSTAGNCLGCYRNEAVAFQETVGKPLLIACRQCRWLQDTAGSGAS